MPATIRTRAAAILVLAAALLFLTLTACTGASSTGEAEPGDDATPEATPAPTSSPTPDTGETPNTTTDPAVEARARSYLLTIEDLPAGWTVEPPDTGTESDLPDYPGDVPPECEVFIEDEELAGTLIEVESDDFEATGGTSVSSDATIMEDARYAADAFFLYGRLSRDCGTTIENAFTFYLEHELMAEAEADDVEIAILEAGYDEFDFPTYGDETFASRLALLVEYDATPVPFNVDIIAIRVGDAVVSFTYTYTSNATEAPQRQQELAALLEQKLQAPTP